MIPRQYEPSSGKDDLQQRAQWTRDVRKILTAGQIGIRWADQIGTPLVVSIDDIDTLAPVPTGLVEPPLSVVCLFWRAEPDDNLRYSGGLVTWEWAGNGSIVIHAIDGVSSAQSVVVTLGLVR